MNVLSKSKAGRCTPIISVPIQRGFYGREENGTEKP